MWKYIDRNIYKTWFIENVINFKKKLKNYRK